MYTKYIYTYMSTIEILLLYPTLIQVCILNIITKYHTLIQVSILNINTHI